MCHRVIDSLHIGCSPLVINGTVKLKASHVSIHLPEHELSASQEKLLQSVPLYPKSHLHSSASMHTPWPEQLFSDVQVG